MFAPIKHLTPPEICSTTDVILPLTSIHYTKQTTAFFHFLTPKWKKNAFFYAEQKKTCKFEALQRRTQQDTVPPEEKRAQCSCNWFVLVSRSVNKDCKFHCSVPNIAACNSNSITAKQPGAMSHDFNIHCVKKITSPPQNFRRKSLFRRELERLCWQFKKVVLF